MKGLKPLFFGLFATFAFSWLGLALVPNAQIGHLEPQSDEEGTDVYPLPISGMAERGRQVFTANGCFYCHSQQVRADYAAADVARKWGERRSAPRDYIFSRPVLLGKSRLGPDLANVGKRPAPETAASPAAGASPGAATPPPAGAPPAAAPPTAAASPAAAANAPAGAAPPAAAPAPGAPPEPAPPDNGPYSAAWHHKHLYAPRSVNPDSNMPSYRFLYEERRIGAAPSLDGLQLSGKFASPQGREIVPSYEAQCLVAYLMSLDQTHPLNELKSNLPPAAPKAAAAAAASPAK